MYPLINNKNYFLSKQSVYIPGQYDDRRVCRQRSSRFVIGVGSIRGTPLEVIGQGVMQRLDELSIKMAEVDLVTSIHIKSFDPAYNDFARIHDVPFVTCDAVSLLSVNGEIIIGERAAWSDPRGISERSALYFSKARQLYAPSVIFRLSHGAHCVAVSICQKQ